MTFAATHFGHGMKSHKLNPFMFAYMAVLILLASLGYFIGDYTVRQRDRIVTNPNFASDVSYLTLPQMNMSVVTANGESGRIRLNITLEVEKKDLGRLNDYQPLITDKIITYMRHVDTDELAKKNASPWLRKELLREVNSVSYPVPVMDVIFRQFLVM